jgi:hypothetical protein
MDPSLSNSLVELAARIRAEHASAEGTVKRGVEHAIAAGDLLIEAKSKLQDGQWLTWLNEHCEISDRTARRYMRVARNKMQLATKNGHVADLSLRGALDVLTAHLVPDDEWTVVMPLYERAREAVIAAAEGIGLGSLESDMALVEAARKAMAEASKVDEPAALDDPVQRLRAYRRQTETEPSVAAVEITLRMERRLGQELLAQNHVA